MSYFKMRLSVDQDQIAALRAMPDRARSLMRVKMQTILKPELQTDVNALMEQGPALVSPFEFGGRDDKSARYYFALVTNNPSLSDGRHWIRKGDLEDAWNVTIGTQFREGSIAVINQLRESTGTKPFPAFYVYGPYAPLGHINSGWPQQAEIARQLLREKAISRIWELWRESLDEAARGRG